MSTEHDKPGMSAIETPLREAPRRSALPWMAGGALLTAGALGLWASQGSSVAPILETASTEHWPANGGVPDPSPCTILRDSAHPETNVDASSCHPAELVAAKVLIPTHLRLAADQVSVSLHDQHNVFAFHARLEGLAEAPDLAGLLGQMSLDDAERDHDVAESYAPPPRWNTAGNPTGAPAYGGPVPKWWPTDARPGQLHWQQTPPESVTKHCYLDQASGSMAFWDGDALYLHGWTQTALSECSLDEIKRLRTKKR